jgi:hypothetical protein
MSADAKNRQAIREAIATLLSAGLTGSGKPVAEVSSSQKTVINATPLVQVLSAGSQRSQKGLGTTKYANKFYVEVQVLIRDTDDTGLNEGEREDRLDLIDKMFADIIADNRSGNEWDYLGFVGELGGGQSERSRATKIIWDGKPYLLEVYQLEVTAND